MLLAGKKGLVMGVANDHSIAWIVAAAARRHGATLAFTYQDDSFGKRLKPLAASVDSDIVLPCDVEKDSDLDAVFETLAKRWGRLDFVVHAIAYSNRDELKGRYLDTTWPNFARTLAISCYSFTGIARRAAAMANDGASLLTFTFSGARRVMPSYNVMGVAKAALEASVRYMAVDLGARGIRVNAISAGPMRTLAGAAIRDSRSIYKWTRENAPLGRNITAADGGGGSLYLLSDLSRSVTGEVHYVDAGYNRVGMPAPRRPIPPPPA